MSQENVELVRRGYAAFNRQDFEAWLDFLDPQVEFREMVLAPDSPLTTAEKPSAHGLRVARMPSRR